ncbi:MAG: Rne/Rng family ribonuclease [Gammaproteobacteria bacterium]|nr:Rne/Rng family ribonuclease [Gammaproteobacteria bacterium]
MSTELLVNVTPRETRVALVENGVLQEVFLDRESCRGLVGNVYKGRVSRVLPGMQAAFIDIGLDRAAFLHASDIAVASRPPSHIPEERPLRECGDEGSIRRTFNGNNDHEHRPIEDIAELLVDGQETLVQVIKDPLGTKGARLTTQISLPSRYVVFMPYIQTIGVSQRIEDEEERQRLRKLAQDYVAELADTKQNESGFFHDPNAPEGHGGYIIRTAAEGLRDDTIHADMRFLHQLWRSLRISAGDATSSRLAHQDLPLVMRILRETVGTEVERMRIDLENTYHLVTKFAERFIPEMAPRVEFYSGERPIFDIYGVEDELQRALERKVQLKSGGHLVFDQTEAMTTIDVNTGAFVGHRNLEETIFKTNLEATQAISRQLRLRNLGGIIIIDFIDMCSDEHKRQVLRSLEKNLNRDHTKTHISEVSSLGLVQMTRKRTRESLEHVLCEPCPTCNGRGSVKTSETVCYEIFREIIREARQYEAEKLLVLASQEVVDRLLEDESSSVAELETFIKKPIQVQVEPLYAQEQYDVVLM